MTTPPTPSLPVSLTPRLGEDLPCYLQRLAQTNLLTPADLGWTRRESVLRHRDTVDLAVVAECLGVPVEDLAPLTVLGYGPAVTGRTMPGAQRTGWRIHQQRRTCPACPPDHRDVGWDLALHLTCRTHHRLLTPPEWPHHLAPVPDDDALHLHAAHVADALARAHEPGIRAQIRLTHRLARLASYTASSTDGATWPPVASAHLNDLAATHPWPTPGRAEAAADLPWTTSRTPRHPIALAVLVAAAWQAAQTPADTRTLIREAWARIDAAPHQLSRRTIRSLPRRPRPSRARLEVARTVSAAQAAHQLHRLRLHPRHVPLLLPNDLTALADFSDGHDDGLLPPLHLIPERHDLARLLLALLHHPADLGAALSPEVALRVGPTPQHSPLSELRLTGRVPLATLHLLKSIGRRLAQDAVDYQERRRLLAGFTHTPDRLPPSGYRDDRGERALAAGWVWVHLTRGPLVHALHPFTNTTLMRFDRGLEPEDRLLLHDYGHDLLTQNTDLVRESAPTTGTADQIGPPLGRRDAG